MRFRLVHTAITASIGFLSGVIFLNGSPIETFRMVNAHGVASLFETKTKIATACIPSSEQEQEDEIFFLSCGGIF